MEDDTVYRLAIATNELPEEMQEKAETFDISTEAAFKNYIIGLHTFGASDIVWEE